MNSSLFFQSIRKSILLLGMLIILVCIIYPGFILLIGQTAFHAQANGSLVHDANGLIVGSKLIAQSFSAEHFFHPRPSAANYNASASSSSALAVSNYALRDRAAQTLGPIVKYTNGNLVGPDIEKWLAADRYRYQPNIVAQWAATHPTAARAWLNARPERIALAQAWLDQNPDVITTFVNEHPDMYQPKPSVFAIQFLQAYSTANPGKLPFSDSQEIQAIFFDMWHQDNPQAELQPVAADFITTSASGLDPHITTMNAQYQLPRIAKAWAAILNRDIDDITNEIQHILQNYAEEPLAGLAGEPYINVLLVNMELLKKFS